MLTPLSRDEFLGRYGNLFQSLYSARAPLKSSFRNSHWRFALTLSDFSFRPDNFECLCQAIRTVGDDAIVVTELLPSLESPGHQFSAVISLDFDDYRAMEDDDGLFWQEHLNTAMFGPSGSWAAIRDTTYAGAGYMIFGAEDKIMDTWLELRGGIDAVRQEFVAAWEVHPKLPPRVRPPEVLAAILADVGW